MEKNKRKHGWNICGARVKLARERKRMSQFQLAVELSGRVEELKGEDYPISRSSIAEIEGGTRFVKEFELLILSRILEIDIQWLLGVES